MWIRRGSPAVLFCRIAFMGLRDKKIKIRLLHKKANRLVYSLPDLDRINDAFIDGVRWPENIAYLGFWVPRAMAPQGKPVRDMVSDRKYVCRMSYVADKREIPAEISGDIAAGLKIAPFKNIAAYRRTFLRTHNKYFQKAFKGYHTPAYGAEVKKYLKNTFPDTKGVCVMRGRRVVGMLSLFKIGKYFRFSPMHWITWLWADQSQPKDVRRGVHFMLRAWVRKNASRYVGASIHAVNVKSQKWFIKLGARPCQIYFSRR